MLFMKLRLRREKARQVIGRRHKKRQLALSWAKRKLKLVWRGAAKPWCGTCCHLEKKMVALKRQAKDHFIPHRGNNHHPHVLKHRVLLSYSVILILIKILAVVGPIALPSSSLYSSAITPENIVDLTNQTRENLNLMPLKENDYLAKAAAAKAADMLKNQYFAHTSPEGVTPWDWIKQVGYKYRYSGENLAVHFEEAEDVDAGWLASPTHRANIVSPNYTEIGVGVANGIFEGVPTTFVVQMFGAPAVGSSQLAAVSNTISASRLITDLPLSGSSEVNVNTNAEGPKKISEPPVINESSAIVKPLAGAYSARLEIRNAESATLSLGEEQSSLARAGTSNIWKGEVKYNDKVMARAGEPIILTVANTDTPPITKRLMLVAPSSPTQQFYIFDEGKNKFVKLFGFLKIGNLDDKVRQFYLAFIVFLGGSLLLTLFIVKFQLRHPSLVKNTLVVILLALFLATI